MVIIHCGDITRLAVDAVVNAANRQLVGGGGVDGAIHRAAGYSQLQQACSEIGGCPTGEVRVTPGFNLPARYIFHAVGPVWQGGQQDEEKLLAACYRHAMELAGEYRLTSIAFPAISCGIYGFPPSLAAPIAVKEVFEGVKAASLLKKVIFCCFDKEIVEHYRIALTKHGIVADDEL